jgi:catechol 2,3-dioxygenase-like lactoylglutathione lyase family enzyme
MLEDMTIQRMDHVGVVVDDLEAATAFFVELGLELEGEAAVEGRWVDASSGSTMSESTSQWCGLRTVTAGLS